MAVTYPSVYDPVDDGELLLPVALAPALTKTLANANCHYQQHLPSPLSVVYTAEPLTTRTTYFRLPMTPSADGLDYDFRHVFITGSGTTAITITIEEQTAGGGWSTIYGPTAQSAGASTTVVLLTTAIVTAGIDEVRITYSRGGDPTTPISVTAIPAPGSPTTRQASGFWPYDTGLLEGTGGAPVNTELCNRATRNVRAVTADRAQCLLSFAQESTSDALYGLDDSQAAAGQWTIVAHGWASVPFAPSSIDVDVSAIASVDGGATTGLVRVDGGGESAVFDADGTVQARTIACQVWSPGTLGARVCFSAYAKRETGQLTYVHAVTASYAPEVPATLPVTTPDAPATIALLMLLTRGVEALALRPWAQPALCFAGNLTDLTVRRWYASIPPACQRAQMCIIRSSQTYGAVQSSTVIETTSASGVPASPAAYAVTVPTPSRGAEAYYDLGGGEGAPTTLWSSSGYDNPTPAATTDRLLPLTEALAAGLEVVQVTYATGAALHLTAVRPPSGYQDI